MGFTVHQQGYTHFLHHGHGGFCVLHGLHTAFAIRGSPRRIKLDPENQVLEPLQLPFRVRAEKRRHIGLEYIAAAGVHNAAAVGLHLLRIRYGGNQVGHDDRPGEGGGTQGGDQFQHVAVPQMKMHVQRRVQFQNHAGIMPEATPEIKHGPPPSERKRHCRRKTRERSVPFLFLKRQGQLPQR